MSNNDGKIENIILPVTEVKAMSFQMAGYKELTLEANSLESDLLSINVTLQAFESIEYDNVPRIGKYLIRSNKTSIELYGMDSLKEIIYTLKNK
jgi:hypothetical protein